MAGLVFGLVFGLVAGLAAGLATAFAAALAYGRGNKIPKRIAPMQWRRLFRRRPLLVGLLTGLAGALVAGLVFGLTAGLAAGLAGGLAAGLAVWSGTGLAAATSRPGTDNTSPLSPLRDIHLAGVG